MRTLGASPSGVQTLDVSCREQVWGCICWKIQDIPMAQGFLSADPQGSAHRPVHARAGKLGV